MVRTWKANLVFYTNQNSTEDLKVMHFVSCQKHATNHSK